MIIWLNSKSLFYCKSFRHDLGNLVISMSLAIEEENIPEIRRIHRSIGKKL